MFLFAFLILSLSLGHDNVRAADLGSTNNSSTSAAPTTNVPTAAPTTVATTTNVPTAAPTTHVPTAAPTTAAPTTHVPTAAPTAAPTTNAPTAAPTAAPTTHAPTAAPTTHAPTAAPTTHAPTAAPTTHAPTAAPTTHAPTAAPTTHAPTAAPTTHAPTAAPTTHAPTAAPTTHVPTAAPTTHVPTAAPTTNATTPAPVPTTTPTPTLPTPATGKYSVSPDVNSTACLMANFGLQIGFKQGGKDQEINLDPNTTSAQGFCKVNNSVLSLKSDKVTIVFSFSNDAKKFHLQALNVTIQPSTGVIFTAAQTNLTLWQAALGSSYMCSKEQSYNITDTLTLHTYELRVQPFEVAKGEFSTAHECSMDDISILIPIIVGAALAGLILIVVIAYVIGRRRTYVGYQTL